MINPDQTNKKKHKNRKIIWSLFDSETAITLNLNNHKYKVITIGVASGSSCTRDFKNIDLSKKSCLKKLNKLEKPDVIFASPPCETWVSLSIGNVRFYNRDYNEYNLYWKKDWKGNDFTKKLKEKRLLGRKTAYWTAEIIKKFSPELWVIENGMSSLIFDFLKKYQNVIGYHNNTYYSAYNKSFSPKPTTFYSNMKFVLKDYMIKTGKTIENKGKGFDCITSYADRSRVPIGIYEDILLQYEGYGQQYLF